ncbi:hypothetical protein Atai01_62310 [Amycolatopsis taiwanensis]|uniref:Uncharacterized protein n=1 Tax=Amycolatopsis taiwanensis TaxID=342230 RepID=A0A9W6R8Q5_9PSEU|nr:hypothetical protein Atai01_62310 [Amycolatopsis taiwanensis]
MRAGRQAAVGAPNLNERRQSDPDGGRAVQTRCARESPGPRRYPAFGKKLRRLREGLTSLTGPTAPHRGGFVAA